MITYAGDVRDEILKYLRENNISQHPRYSTWEISSEHMIILRLKFPSIGFKELDENSDYTGKD